MLKVRQTIPSRIPNPAKTDIDTKSFWDRYRNSSITTVWSAGGPKPKKTEEMIWSTETVGDGEGEVKKNVGISIAEISSVFSDDGWAITAASSLVSGSSVPLVFSVNHSVQPYIEVHLTFRSQRGPTNKQTQAWKTKLTLFNSWFTSSIDL